MSLSLAENRRMAAALFYLQATTLAGALNQRLRRLREPKYLLGALLFVFYFGMAFGRPAWQAQTMTARHFDAVGLDALGSVFAIGLFAWALVAWAVPSARATLRFSEAEIAFLFPAPLTRIGLVNFSLLRALLGIFLSAFLLSLMFGRGRGLPGNALQHATAIWLAIATMRLHSLAASFTLASFAEGGRRPWLRRLLAPALVLLGLLALGAWLATHSPAPPATDTQAGVSAFLDWLRALLHAPPLAIVLAPFRWLAAPLLRADQGWWLSLLPVLALLLAHYAWVVRANLAFEEAAIDAAAKRARQAENIRTGKWPWSSGRRSANNEPFALATQGPPVLAFLWSGMIGAGGGLWRPRIVGAVLLATVLVVAGLAASPWASLLKMVAAIAAGTGILFVLFGAMLMQGRLRGILELLDIYKASPLSGRQIALGQLLTPMALATAGQWYSLFVVAACVLASGNVDLGNLSFSWAGALGAVLLGPLLCALLMCIPFAWILWFPAWAATLGTRGGGFEAAGQRMIFTFVYLFAAALALLPALALGALVAWLGHLLGVPASLSMLLAAVLAAAVLAVELGAIVHVLGARIERLDVSTELR
jgi:hypothetical protein